jgi:16S rRNA (guanine966-N2)-methyltransferase
VKPPSKSAPTVRILAGRWKGKRLDVPRGARPTSGRAREALFDILQESVVGGRVLDLYAGSGAIGLEALSRGAAEAVFVETDRRALDANLFRCAPAAETVEVFGGDARRAIDLLSREGRRFDLVFADPPYSRGVSALSGPVSDLVAPGGRLVLQTDSDEEAPEIAGLAAAGRRAYARNVLWLFERSGA